MANAVFDLDAGIAAREEGKNRITEHHPHFVHLMRAYAKWFARQHGTVTADDLRIFSVEHDIHPKHKNAWGAIFRGPDFVEVGWAKSTLVSNHAHKNRVWKLREEGA